jgi:hypothetical protein
MAAQIRAQFSTWPSHLDGSASQDSAFVTQLARKSLCGRAAAALVGNVFGDGTEIIFGRSAEAKPGR